MCIRDRANSDMAASAILVTVLVLVVPAAAFETSLRQQQLHEPTSPLDVRVTLARLDRGYSHARLSVVHPTSLSDTTITGGPDPLSFQYTAPFVNKWEASYDLGSAHQRCAAGVYSTTNVTYDADCMNACSKDDHCMAYSWFSHTTTCQLASSDCSTLTSDPTADATYRKYQRNWLNSAIVPLREGQNTFWVAGHHVNVTLPRQGSGVRGIVISDPCFSGRWVDCAYGESWDNFNRSVRMLNALAEHDDIDFFAILGDNFYDQDGRLTTAIWRQLSQKFKQTFLITTPGNHDIWVAGGPGPTADQYDQYAHGFMQFYAQDSAASSEDGKSLFNLSIVPTVPVNPLLLNNSPSNFLLYHQLGNIGMISYLAGGVNISELAPGLRDVCAEVGKAEGIQELLLLGHWNDESSGCLAGSDVPEVYALLANTTGCAGFGDKMRFMDGHTHCNHVQGAHGFMIGGHGMSGCGQVGFAMLDSTGADLKVSYFEERTATNDQFEQILACVVKFGASGCTHLAQPWL
eukprot:TRINITY_DN22441_c0_g1_i1.p1 TRINITY_DN22441_c0_g1~~TRINITY_DN22441_c0_g1_i1.p1  ORF type:complete len:518 (-),score=69.79 TRINITY_DN22441_c0_g1_i1:59-1612(-)